MDDDDIWEVSDEEWNFSLITCPYYHGIGSCRNACSTEPSCVTDGPLTPPDGWTLEQCKERAQLRNDHELATYRPI